MDTNLAGLAPSLTPTTTDPDWLRNEDRYYGCVSPALPSLVPVLRLLARLGAALRGAPVLAWRETAA